MSTSGGRRPISALAALALTGALAACSGGSGSSSTSTAVPTTSMTYYLATSTAAPGMLPSATPSAVGTASAAPTAAIAPPVMPAEAKAHTPDGAAAFARYYMDLINYSWQKPDAQPLRSMALPSCKTCAAMAAQADEYAAQKSHLDRDATVTQSSDPEAPRADGAEIIAVVALQQPYRLISPTGTSAPQTSTRIISEFALLWRDGGWRVDSISTPR